MKLYYKSGACSLATHIVLNELNMDYELEKVDLATKTSASGDYRKINPKGSVPALKMENGEILTEGAVISQYLADQKPEAGLIPKFGTLDRYRCLELLNFVGTEIHKGFSPLFGAERMLKNVEGQAELRHSVKETLMGKIQFASDKLGEQDYLLGKSFTIVDAYLFTCLNWTKFVGIEMGKWPNLETFMKRVAERPAVKKAMKEEGLI